MDEFDSVAARLRALGDHPVDPAVASRHLTAMAEVRHAAAGPRLARFARARVVAAFAAGLVIGGTGLASAGTFGDTAQNAVADAAAKVGVNLPGGTPRSTEGCGGKTYKNHGDFVKQGGDPHAACGKPLTSTTGGTEPDSTDDGASHGKSGQPHGKSGKHGSDEQGNETSTTVGNDNAGVPSGGTVPSSNSQGDDHRPATPPSTDHVSNGSPSGDSGQNGTDNGKGESSRATTTTVTPTTVTTSGDHARPADASAPNATSGR